MIEVFTKMFMEKLAQMTNEQRYRAVGAFFVGSTYEWGKENPQGADCSGLVSGALMASGYNIRVTADDFINKVFTEEAYSYDKDKIQAVFYITKKPYDTPDGQRPAGIARHVVMLVGDGVVINANSFKNVIEYRTLEDIDNIFLDEDCYSTIRSLDPEKARKMQGTVYGLDKELGGTDE